MRKILIATTLTALAMTGCIASEPSIQKDEIKTTVTTTKQSIMELPTVKAHKFIPQELKKVGSMTQAMGYFNTPRGKRQAIMFISADQKTIVYGRGFNAKTGKEYKSYSVEELKKFSGIVYGSGTEEYFLVVDPLCPVCKSFDKTLPTFEKEIKLYVIFLPLVSLHPKAPNAIAYILSQKTQAEKFEAMQKISDGDKEYLKYKTIPKSIQQQMDKQIRLSELLGTRGTPTLYDKNGNGIGRGVLKYRHEQLVGVKNKIDVDSNKKSDELIIQREKAKANAIADFKNNIIKDKEK